MVLLFADEQCQAGFVFSADAKVDWALALGVFKGWVSAVDDEALNHVLALALGVSRAAKTDEVERRHVCLV